MEIKKVVCPGCKENIDGKFFLGTKEGFVPGHPSCLRNVYGDGRGGTYLKKFCWEDGKKGGYSPGWLNDVKHRKVVGRGEIVRDYKRTHFI